MIIGLTGGIGSGKSTIAKALTRFGYTLYDCDSRAKNLIQTDPLLHQQLCALFGEQTYQDGCYQTRYMAQQVFGHPERLAQLNAIVHPRVEQDILQQAQLHNPLLVESAILFESGLYHLCHRTIAILAPEAIRLGRVIRRDGSSREDVLARMQSQISDQERQQKATLSVTNDGSSTIEELCQYIVHNL